MMMNFKIDQTATFAGLVFLSCEPKTEMGSDRQATTKDKTPKWEVQVLGAARDSFGKTNNEVIKVGIASHHNPAEGLAPFTPVQLVGFEVGVMEKTKKLPDGTEKQIGVTVWFRAAQIRDVAATPVANGSAGKAA